ncbi:MAG: histidine phosphatase family protein [Clostridia bacterium]|nr:histidine phosphatase family protein [Clostridia bacterium]
MKLLLIRHGRTAANEKRLYCGSTDIPLSADGRARLEALKQTAAYPVPEDARFITSGLKRCRETLDILFGTAESETESGFCEMDFGAFEMRSYEELKNVPEYIEWISGDNESNVCPGGESGAIMKARVLAALEKVIKENKNAVIITHGGVIAAIMEYLFPQERKNRYEWQPECGRGYSVDTSAGNYEEVPR